MPFYLEHTALTNFSSLSELEDLCSQLERTRICVQRRAQAHRFNSMKDPKHGTPRTNAFPRPHSSSSYTQHLNSVAANNSVSVANNSPSTSVKSNSPNENSESSSSFSSFSKNKVVCFNCNQLGHLRSSCPRPFRLHCYLCGRNGVSIRTCPKCSVLPSNGGDGK